MSSFAPSPLPKQPRFISEEEDLLVGGRGDGTVFFQVRSFDLQASEWLWGSVKMHIPRPTFFISGVWGLTLKFLTSSQGILL